MFSHDFRGPLSSILLTNSLLRDYSSHLSDERRLTHLNHIEASARLLLQMLDDILVIAQLENGSLEFKAEPVDINALLQQIVENCRLIYGVRQPIRFTSTGGGPALVDPRLLLSAGRGRCLGPTLRRQRRSRHRPDLCHAGGDDLLLAVG